MRSDELVGLALVAASCVACGGGIEAAPRFSATHRVSASPEAVCQDLARAAFANGRELVVRQPERFAVRARFADRFGPHMFAVECLPHGVVTVRPYGPRVEPSSIGRLRTEDLMPAPLREELAAFTQSVRSELARLESGAVPWAHDPPPPSRAALPEEVAGIHADRGIIATGGLSLAASYLLGSFTTLGLSIDCYGPYRADCEVGVTTLAFIPLAHWTAGTSNYSPTATAAIVTGIVFSALELVSIIVMFAGAAHHRASPGALSVGPGTLSIAF